MQIGTPAEITRQRQRGLLLFLLFVAVVLAASITIVVLAGSSSSRSSTARPRTSTVVTQPALSPAQKLRQAGILYASPQMIEFTDFGLVTPAQEDAAISRYCRYGVAAAVASPTYNGYNDVARTGAGASDSNGQLTVFCRANSQGRY